MTLLEHERRRATTEDYRKKRAALEHVQPTINKLPAWHQRAAHLAGISRAQRSRGKIDPNVLREANELWLAVFAEQRLLEIQTSALPDDIASNSRIVDVRRSLESVQSTLSLLATGGSFNAESSR